jgi:hypothetical protein
MTDKTNQEILDKIRSDIQYKRGCLIGDIFLFIVLKGMDLIKEESTYVGGGGEKLTSTIGNYTITIQTLQWIVDIEKIVDNENKTEFITNRTEKLQGNPRINIIAVREFFKLFPFGGLKEKDDVREVLKLNNQIE